MVAYTRAQRHRREPSNAQPSRAVLLSAHGSDAIRDTISVSRVGDGDREGGDEQRDAVGQHERQVVAREALGDPEGEPDQKHGEVANRDAG
jgi:hypothetical protein